MMSTRNNGGKFLFTESQWQELEHQALVYKYMISGMPIPPDLIFTIKRSLESSTKLFLHHQPPHPSIGWNCFQMGFGRKIDPEPGRCRRTDGKKWRCSKEAYPDSKYCERHMHRGRNRSRKPVEVNMSNPPPPSAKSPNYPPPNSDYHNSNFHFSHSLPSSRPNLPSSHAQDHFLMGTGPYSHSHSRNSYGMKDELGEHPFFSETSGTIKTMGASMADSWHLEPLAINKSSSYTNHRTSFSDDQNGYSYLQPQNTPKQQEQKQDQLALKLDKKDEPQKVMHHFFDEWPPNNDDDDDDDPKDSSTTQLSISMPTPAHDFFRTDNGK